VTRERRFRLVAIALAAVTVDAVAKLAAVRWLDSPIDLPGLTLRVARNAGVAFSLGADQPFALVATVTGIVVIVLTLAAWRGHLGGPATAGLVVGGGVANLVDRLIGGTVVDLFDLGWFPVFNLADAFITIGMGLLILIAVRQPDGPEEAHETAPSRVGSGRG
jgi:signal peptidase II